MKFKQVIIIFLVIKVLEAFKYYFIDNLIQQHLPDELAILSQLGLILLLFSILWLYINNKGAKLSKTVGLRQISNFNRFFIFWESISLVVFILCLQVLRNPGFYNTIASNLYHRTFNLHIDITKWILTLLKAGIAVPIWEEIMIRGLLGIAIEEKYGRWKSIVFTSIIFSIMHLSFPRLLIAFLFGIGLAWLASVTKSIIPSIGVHLFYNSLIVSIVEIAYGINDSNIFSTWVLLLVTLIALVSLILSILWSNKRLSIIKIKGTTT